MNAGKIIFCLLNLLLVVNAKQLPSFITPCCRKEEVGDCILEKVEILRPKLNKGIPSMYIPALDPLIIPEVVLDGGRSFKAIFTNIHMYYVNDFKIDHLEYNTKTLKIRFKIQFPFLRLMSPYHLQGRLLVLELNGGGNGDGNYTNVKADFQAHGTKHVRDGKTYLKMHQDKFDLDVGKPHFLFDKIFGDNEELNEQTNRAINENVDALVDELIPLAKQVISTFGFGIVDKIHDKFSFDELFPEC